MARVRARRQRAALRLRPALRPPGLARARGRGRPVVVVWLGYGRRADRRPSRWYWAPPRKRHAGAAGSRSGFPLAPVRGQGRRYRRAMGFIAAALMATTLERGDHPGTRGRSQRRSAPRSFAPGHNWGRSGSRRSCSFAERRWWAGRYRSLLRATPWLGRFVALVLPGPRPMLGARTAP